MSNVTRPNFHPISYRGRHLFMDGVSIREVVSRVGTPCYIYSAGDIRRRFGEFDDAFATVPHRVCYAVKANSNLAILKLFRTLGSGFDVVSGGELFRVLRAGANPRAVVFSGVGKTAEEIDFALSRRIGQFNVESAAELELLAARAQALRVKAEAGLRVNPDVDPRTHPYIATGLREHKFGIDIHSVDELFRAARSRPFLRLRGLGFHIGSQILSLEPFADAAAILANKVRQLRAAGFEIHTLDLGGGLGISYRGERTPPAQALARRVLPILRPLGCTLFFEPGRWLVGRAGVLVTRVLFLKRNGRKNFVVVDAGMNDLIRPTLYQAFHQILPVERSTRTGSFRADVVGPICETGDFFARDRRLRKPQPGELLAIGETGAYGFSLASNYNARPRCPEILIDASRARLIRRRESPADLVRGEILSPIRL
ncbi:MAG: diaminopimelate decarboxylase [Acidobacteriia bacterium]|nr:diaminopimelate decarboxylase [Terriglobia bacterium]